MKAKKDTINHKLINNYKKYRNKFKMLIQKTKEQDYINKIWNQSNQCEANRQEIYELIGREKTLPALPVNEIIENNYPNSKPKEYLNISYFATAGSRLVENNFPNNTNKTQS